MLSAVGLMVTHSTDVSISRSVKALNILLALVFSRMVCLLDGLRLSQLLLRVTHCLLFFMYFSTTGIILL